MALQINQGLILYGWSFPSALLLLFASEDAVEATNDNPLSLRTMVDLEGHGLA
jgi:hypothetical protein